MLYTVKQLSSLSGVTSRTLHFYDEIGLLKPAKIGENGYRYYKEEQFLILQQILFFRELGFPLKEIQKIILSNEFNQVRALELHRSSLIDKILRTQKLIATIDKTIAYLQGQIIIDNNEIYSGFDKVKQLEYDEYLVKKHGVIAEIFIAEAKERTKNWSQRDFIQVRKQHDLLYQKFNKALQHKLKPESIDVQKLVQEHYELVQIFYTPTKEVYASLGQTYCEHPDLRQYFDSFNLALAEYLAQAIKYFAEHQLI